MKTLFALIVAAICHLPSPACSAASPYQQGEVTVDTFATFTVNKAKFTDTFTTDFKPGTWGYGVGATYFFHRNFGIGLDAAVLNARQPSSVALDQVNLDLVARLPIGESGLAPYVSAGSGRNLETGEYIGHAAAGLEYRFQKPLGVFAEARYTWARGNQSDTAQARAGLRFAF